MTNEISIPNQALPPASSIPDGDCPQCPQPQLPQTIPAALADIGGPSPNPERREGVPPPSPALAQFNPERSEGVPPPSPALAHFNPERREGVSSPSPALAHFNPERREGVSTANSSTGPKTEAGKSISSRNAVTHGLRATKIENAVTPALRHQYDTLRRQYLDDYRPSGAIENTLFDMLVFAAWQLYKIRDMELFTDLDLGMPGSFGRSEKLARYRGSHERLFFRSLNQLKQIQQERALRETDQKAALPTHLPPGVRLKSLQVHLRSLTRHPRAHSASVSNGSTRQNPPSARRPTPASSLQTPSHRL